MRVLVHLRSDWQRHRGGDVVQALRWAGWLEALGAKVTVAAESAPSLAGVDLLLLTNLGRAAELLPTLEHARQRGTPIALSPLFWPTEEFETQGRPGWFGRAWRCLPVGLRQRAKTAWRWAKQPTALYWLRDLCSGSDHVGQRLLAGVNALVATSQPEAIALEQHFRDLPPIQVVPIGVDAIYHASDPEAEEIEARFLPQRPARNQADPVLTEWLASPRRRGLVCVARFDPQKGQHRLLQALRGLDEELLLVGPDNPNYPGYRRECQRLADTKTRFLDSQPPTILKQIFARARVHVLVSWYETTGLTGLEAACQGAKVVVTDRGGTRDYYADLAWYASPTSLPSIRQAVEAALAAPAVPRLAERVRQHFTWRQSSQRLLAVLEQVAGTARRRHAA